MAKSNNADAFRIHLNMMQMSGMWPERCPSTFYKTKAAISWIFGIALFVTMLVEFINDITDITKLSEILYIMVSVLIYLIKLAVFTYKKKTFLNMIDFLKDPVFVSYPDALDHYMARTIKTSSLMANFYRYLCLCCMVLFVVYPVLDKKVLPFPFPYDMGRYTYAMYVFQIVGIGTVAWNNSCLDTLTTSLMGIGAAQLDILMEKLLWVGDEGSEMDENECARAKRIVKTLQKCVNHHLAIIKFIEYIESVFTGGILAQFMASIMVICNTLFHFVLISRSSSQFFMLANYFAIMATQLYIYCWYGNEIMWKRVVFYKSADTHLETAKQAQKLQTVGIIYRRFIVRKDADHAANTLTLSVLVGQACYLSRWYDYGNEIGQYLFIMMERSKRPLAISALKFSKLSLTAFTSIIQWSYSYLALLLKMYYKETPAQEKDVHA